MQFTIGTDPEYFLVEGDKFVSAIGKIKGTKDKPFPTDFGSIHADNVAVEINVPPSTNGKDFAKALDKALHRIYYHIPSNTSLSHESVAKFDSAELQHPDAVKAGCDPDFNAYMQAYNNVPCLMATPVRCVGGHIHIGADIPDGDKHQLAKVMDLYVALPMLGVDHPVRRRIYGGAGAYRPKPYGMEYRTPSNHWTFTQDTVLWVYEQTKRALMDYKQVVIPDELGYIINSHSVADGEALMSAKNVDKYPNVTQ